MYTVLEKTMLTNGLARLWVKAPGIAQKAQPGQFVIVRAGEDGERLPFTIAGCDASRDAVMLLIQSAGRGSMELVSMEEGDQIASVTGPLGRPTQFHGAKRVVCVGGGVGAAVLYPQVRHLRELGCYIEVVEGARSQDLLVLKEELGALADQIHFITDDGSSGRKGFVTDVLKERLDEGAQFDLCIAIGPPQMMRAVSNLTREYGLRTMVSLNPIMVDGTGMCGGCRVRVGGKVLYACVDGPEFDGHEVDFDSLIRRLSAYKTQEARENHECKGGLYG